MILIPNEAYTNLQPCWVARSCMSTSHSVWTHPLDWQSIIPHHFLSIVCWSSRPTLPLRLCQWQTRLPPPTTVLNWLEFYHAGKLPELKAGAVAAETGETTAMLTGGLLPWILMVGGGGGAAASIKWQRRALYPHRRNVLFLLRRNKIFFERSKNNIDLH